ncbi:MAG: rhodanese-like domain-containing protein [Deltaproteobacteria bacterium]|nr:rhodanese-like domain-containing protein [Deltaproteobacteria bacterium]
MAKPQIQEPIHEYSTISREEILARLQDRALALVNVMPVDSFRAGHIPGSINLPLADIELKAPRLLSNLALEVAIHCAGPT